MTYRLADPATMADKARIGVIRQLFPRRDAAVLNGWLCMLGMLRSSSNEFAIFEFAGLPAVCFSSGQDSNLSLGSMRTP